MHLHKWDNNVKKIDENSPKSITCEKCGQIRVLYHLCHGGIELYYYEVERPELSITEIDRKNRKSGILILFTTLSLILYLAILYFSNKEHTPLFIVVIFIFLLFSYDYSWRKFKLYAKKVQA